MILVSTWAIISHTPVSRSDEVHRAYTAQHEFSESDSESENTLDEEMTETYNDRTHDALSYSAFDQITRPQ